MGRNKHTNNYFSHDSNARNSDKIIPLRQKLGAEGYGIYFMILERLREEPDYTSVKDYNMLAFDFRVDAAKVKTVIEDFGLFSFADDGKRFYSESFLRRMQEKDGKSEKARESVNKRWEKVRSQNDCTENGYERNTTVRKTDTNKEKKRKENITSPADAVEVIPRAPDDGKNRTSTSDEKKFSSRTAAIPPSDSEFDPVEELRDRLRARGAPYAWQVKNAMSGIQAIALDEVWEWLDRFVTELKAKGETTKTPRDFQSHFVSWLKSELRKTKNYGDRNTNAETGKQAPYRVDC